MAGKANTLNESAGVASDASNMADEVEGAANPTRPTSARLAAAISAVSLAARILPTGLRLLRRYPVGSSLAAVGLICLLVEVRSKRR
jgi:hypothetical protein